jgi:hypothetical protein
LNRGGNMVVLPNWLLFKAKPPKLFFQSVVHLLSKLDSKALKAF